MGTLKIPLRNNADYADFFIVSKLEAEEQYARAEEFYQAINDYLAELIAKK